MIIEDAINVLRIEAQSILDLIEKIDSSFEKMVELIYSSTGRVIISGIGKSGLIGKKIVATLTSTGTNSIFLHPVEAMHGDLGIVTKDDIIIVISNSGETEELNRFIPSIKDLNCKLIAFTGNTNSTMATLCDIVIDTGVAKEACPLGLAPTSSTTAQLSMGDALAVTLINKKKFQEKDFEKSHPGGALGQRLASRVCEIMFPLSESPVVSKGASMNKAILEIEKYKLGAVLICNNDQTLAGIITDGDIRHSIATNAIDTDTRVDSIMTKSPQSVSADSYLHEALYIMEKFLITVLPVVDSKNKLEGILHLHDILGKGAFKFNGGVR
ncbi:MAG: KpsF/GutQ family sugar-phosphate isomerase [Desulfobacterales bacterium]|nr:KpsF/GutQ family sugar-phosphate isomerase [Desulfobacterales bacterium]